MKKITYLILIAFIALGFYSCQEDTIPKVEEKITIDAGFSGAISNEGEDITLEFTASGDWTITKEADWLTIDKELGEAGNAVVTITATENTGHEGREAKVTIALNESTIKEEITIIQKQLDALILSSKEISVIAAGEEFSVKVSSNVEIDFDIEATATWITEVTTKTLKDTVLKFKTEANPQTEKRIGKITITCDDIEEIITVTQIGINIAVSKPVKLGNLTISDRNLGAPTYGVAYNYSNYSGHPDHQYSAFKGLYYSFMDLLICPDGWRLPTKEELETISNAMQYSEGRAYLADGEGNRCYFPLSGILQNPSHANGYYWSSTTNQLYDYAWGLFVTTSNSNVDNDYNGSDNRLSVRCVQ